MVEKQVTLDPYVGIPLCKVIVPLPKAITLSLPQAVKVATDFTRTKGSETGFLYDAKTRKPISPLFAGDNCEIRVSHALDLYAGGVEKLGLLHTHPISPETLQHYQQFFKRSPCHFSLGDIEHAAYSVRISAENMTEESLVCPATNEIVFQESPGNIYIDGHSELRPILREAKTAHTRLENLRTIDVKTWVPGQPRPTQETIHKAAMRVFAAFDAIAKALNQRILPLDAFIEGTIK